MIVEGMRPIYCDNCGKRIALGESILFENTADGGWLAHSSCYEVAS